AERRQCVHRLECPSKRQHELAALSKEIEEQSLAAALRLATQKAQISGWVAPVGEDRMTRRTAERGQAREFAAVGIEDGCPAWRKERDKQPVFCRPVTHHIAVVVEVIPGQVGKSGCCHRQT